MVQGWNGTMTKDQTGDDPLTTSEADPAVELIATVAQTVSLFAADTVQETLGLVISQAVATIEGCDYSGIFLLEGEAVVTPVCSDPLVMELDALQHSTGEGPCLDALAAPSAVYAEDLGEDPRWPTFGPGAVALGVRSLLAVPLTLQGAPAALNLYARYPRAFGVIDRGKGLLLAALGGLAFTTASAHEADERKAIQLQAALATREMIGQAQGILMERERVSADEAFDILRRASQHLNLKLRVVAQTLVDTGERPETGRIEDS
jgi:GAF domain-containing protein